MNEKPLTTTHGFDQLIDRFLASSDISRTSNAGNLMEFDLKNEKLAEAMKEQLIAFEYTEEEAAAHSKDLTAYNPTAPFLFNGCQYILVRVEPRNAPYSMVALFREHNGGKSLKWELTEEMPIYKHCEDPFYIGEIDGVYYFGMAEIKKENPDGSIPVHSVIYRFRDNSKDFIKDFRAAEKFLNGPNDLKGIRFCKLVEGKYALLRRPRGGGLGNGRIALTLFTSMNNLTEGIKRPVCFDEIIDYLFSDHEWGGTNQLIVLKNGLLGILGHIARVDKDGKKDYAAAAIIIDPGTKKALHIEVIATTYSFSGITPKNIEMDEILYSGGIIRRENGMATLYAGLGDTVAGFIEIPDPFLEWEN